MSDVIIRPLDLDRDAQRVADMFNESESVWPGGWTQGIPWTADVVREWATEERDLVVYVAEADERIVGYCTFMENTPWPSGQYGSGYLDLLSVHPAYHGRSIGRRLVQATIERAAKEGWVYQTLGTWSANWKSVPTYKKTGHFWRPDTSVWMQNFIPGALQMPLARPFFDRHDWYASYVRELQQHEDDQRWEGMKVYREHWEADGEALTIWIDREAQAPCAIETDDVFVAVIPRDIEPLQGTAVQINWRIQNKGPEPIHAHIHAMGADGLVIDHREAFVVPPGLTVEHVAEVKVGDDAPHGKLDETAPAVRSLITLDHNEVELFCGLRARKPLSVDTDPGSVSVTPGVPTTITVQVHSELPDAVSGTCYLIPSPGLEAGWTSLPVTIDAKGHAALPVALTAGSHGVHTLQVRLVPSGEGRMPAKEEITVFAVTPGRMLAGPAGDDVRVETDALRLGVAGRYGTITLADKERNVSLLSLTPYIGMPYFPSDFDKNHFKFAVETADGQTIVRMQAEPQYHPDMVSRVVVTLSPTGLVTVESGVENGGDDPFTGRLVFVNEWQHRLAPTLTTPLTGGTVRAPRHDFPISSREISRDPADYAEPWVAVEAGGLAMGLGWDASVAEVRSAYEFGLLGQEQTVARGERTAPLRVAAWSGPGDWRTARAALLRWAGTPLTADTPAMETRPVVRAAFERPVLATLEDAISTDLVVDSVSSRKLDGVVRVEGCDGLSVTPECVSIPGLSSAAAVRSPVTLSVPFAPGGYRAHVQAEFSVLGSRSSVDVLRLGAPGRVAVERSERSGRPVWQVENGQSSFTVAQDFGPSVISWQWQGTEQVISPFPEPAGFWWSYPWYAGIQLMLTWTRDGEAGGYLVKDQFQATEVSVEAGGLTWRGVRLKTRPARKELHDIGVEMDYVTLPNSPVIRVVFRLANLRPTRQQVSLTGAAVLGLGAPNLERLVLRGEGVIRRPTDFSSGRRRQTWGAVTNEDTGVTVLGVSPQGKLGLEDYGAFGRYIGLSDDLSLPGGATREFVWYLALSDSLERALTFRGLAQL